MLAAAPSPESSPPARPVPLPIRRALHLVVVFGVVLSVGAVARGVTLMGRDGGAGFELLVALGMLALAALPPALAALLARHVLRKGPRLTLVGLGVRVGALLSFAAVVTALYTQMLLDRSVWLDAQAGLSFLLMPIVTLAIGILSSACGAATGGLIARMQAR